jgi:hypothetical protein
MAEIVNPFIKRLLKFTLVGLMAVLFMPLLNADDAPLFDRDPHYTAIGFFDMHICNWPQRPKFFKVLFSTEKFDEIDSMEVFEPSGASLTILDKKQYMPLKRKNKPEKRVYMVNLDVPDTSQTGWYTIKVKTVDGREITARDYVPLTRIGRVREMEPADDREGVALPVTLKWKKLPGALFYRVYVRDVWTGKMVFESKLVKEDTVKIPVGKLEAGGYYSWTVHARDLNTHILLGDFHMGSMSETAFFNVAD